MSNILLPAMRAFIAAGGTALLLSACVYTGSSFNPNGTSLSSTAPKNEGTIVISEANDVGHPYHIVGDIQAYGRSFNLISSDPTREDVNEALRSEAAKQGADAVIKVRYTTESQGMASRGIMRATGTAVVFTK